MVESQDTIHYRTSHKEKFRKLNDTLWNSFYRNIILSSDECYSIHAHEIDVKIRHCIIKGLKFYLVTIYHKLDIAQINAKNIFRNKLNDCVRGIVMICNDINCNNRQKCTVFSNIVLLKGKNKTQDQYFTYNVFKSHKLQLKSLKIILKFLLWQFNQNFKKINSKNTVVDTISHANFFISSSRRRDSSSVTWCQSVFKSLKNLKNLIETYQYDKKIENSDKSVNNVIFNRQSTIEANNIKRREPREEKHFNATKIQKADKINNTQKLLTSNNSIRSTIPRNISVIDVQSENSKYNQHFQKRRLLLVRKNKKFNSKKHKKTHNKLPFESKVRKSKRPIRSTHDRLFNGNKKIRNKKSNLIPSSPSLTRYRNKDINFKSLSTSSVKKSKNSFLSVGNRELQKVAKNNRRSVNRPRQPLVKISELPVRKIDDKAAKLITTCGNCEDRLRHQQAIRDVPVRKSVGEVIENSQGKRGMQSGITIDKRNYITTRRAIHETQNSPKKLILTLSISDLKDNLEGYSLPLGSLFKDSKFGKLPKSVKIEIIGPTKRKGRHEKREILTSNNYPQDSAANDKSFYDEGMKLEQELKELPKLPFKPRLNKLRNRQYFGKLRSNSRDEESNTGTDGVDSKFVKPALPIQNYPSEFASLQNIAPDTVSSNENKVQSKSENLQDFSKNREKEKPLDKHEMRESDKGSNKESSAYYYDYYDYENSGSNFNRHKSNDLKARQVGRKLLALSSDTSTPPKKLNSRSNEKFYGNQQSEEVGSRLYNSPTDSSFPLFLKTSEINEGPSASKLSQCTFNKSAQFHSDSNNAEKDLNQDAYRKNDAKIGFLKRNLMSVLPARESSLPEDDPLRRLFATADSEEYKGESKEKQRSARYKRGNRVEENDAIRDLYKLFGRGGELNVKGSLDLHFPKYPKKNANNSSRRKRCSGRKRPKGRRKRRCRKRKFASRHQRANHRNDVNDDSIVDLGDESKAQQAAEATDPKSPLEKLKNFFKNTFGEKGRNRIKAKIIKVIPSNLSGLVVEDSDSGELKSWQGNRDPSCKCNGGQTTTPTLPEVAYTSVAVDTINPEGDDGRTTMGELTRQPAPNNDDSGDNYIPSEKPPGHTRGYNCHCHRITSESSTSSPDEQQYQTTIGMDKYSPESTSVNNDLDTPSRPEAEIEISQLPDLQTQTSVAYTSPVINTEKPISSDNPLTTIDSNTNLGNDIRINGDDERMKDVLDILNFVQKVEKLMVNQKMPFRIGDKRGGIEIKLQKIYTPDNKLSIQSLNNGTAGHVSNDLLAESIDTPAIHQTVKNRPESVLLKTKSKENANPKSPSDEISTGNFQKKVDVTFDQLKKQKEDEHIDEFETYIEGRPVDLLSNKKQEQNEKSSAEKPTRDEQKIVPRDQSSPVGDEAMIGGHARKRRKKRRRPKGRRGRESPGRRRLFSAQQLDRRNDFAAAPVDGDAEEQVDQRRGNKSTAYWHYTRCSNKKRKKLAAP